MSETPLQEDQMTVSEAGEFGLIARVAARLPQGPTTLLGPGDDAAVVLASDGRVVASTDLLVEGRHFRRDWSGGYDVGRKAAAANLADIAAMGAVPTSLLVGLACPPDLPLEWADALTDGLRRSARWSGRRSSAVTCPGPTRSCSPSPRSATSRAARR
jgi:thiamine-monophosphate kinase